MEEQTTESAGAPPGWSHFPRPTLAALPTADQPKEAKLAAIKARSMSPSPAHQAAEAAEGELRAARRHLQKLAIATAIRRHELALEALYAENNDLLSALGHRSTVRLLQQRIGEEEGNEKLTEVQVARQLRISRYLPDQTVCSCAGSIAVMEAVAQVGEALERRGMDLGRSRALKMLCGLVEGYAKPAEICRAAEAAETALDDEQDDAAALRAALRARKAKGGKHELIMTVVREAQAPYIAMLTQIAGMAAPAAQEDEPDRDEPEERKNRPLREERRERRRPAKPAKPGQKAVFDSEKPVCRENEADPGPTRARAENKVEHKGEEDRGDQDQGEHDQGEHDQGDQNQGDRDQGNEDEGQDTQNQDDLGEGEDDQDQDENENDSDENDSDENDGDENEGDENEGEEDEGCQEDEADEQDRPQKPATRPMLMYPYQRLLAVPFPDGRSVLSPTEVAACEAITASTAFIRLTYDVLKLRYVPYSFRILDPRLELHVARQLYGFALDLQRFIQRLQERGEEGLGFMEEDFRDEGGDPKAAPPYDCDSTVPAHLRPLLPLPFYKEGEPPIPLRFLIYDEAEPYQDRDIPEACDKRKQVFRLLGLARCAREAVLRLEARDLGDNDDELFLDVAYQLHATLVDARAHADRCIAALRHDARDSLDQEPAWIDQEQQQQQAKEEATSRILVLGDNSQSKQITLWGITADGRQSALSQDIANFIIANGLQGQGKTQVSMIMREGANLSLPGLGFIEQGTRTIEFIVDPNQGDSRVSSFCGLWPNPYPQHWDRLRCEYGVNFTADLARFPRINAFCFVDDLPELNEIFAAERERGLVLHPMGFNEGEMSSFVLRNMLSVGSSANGQVRTQDRVLFESIIGNIGMGRGLDRLEAECKKAKVRSYLNGALKYQFDFIRHKLTNRDGYLSDFLLQPVPMVFLMRSRHLGPGVILPLEVSTMAVLDGELRDGTNPGRCFICHEFGKHGLHEVVVPYFTERATRIRHSVCSYFLETQQIGFLPPEIISLATGILQFRSGSRRDYEKLQELFYAFTGIPFRLIAELLPGQAYTAFVRANDPRCRNVAIKHSFRSTATWAGGETLAIA